MSEPVTKERIEDLRRALDGEIQAISLHDKDYDSSIRLGSARRAEFALASAAIEALERAEEAAADERKRCAGMVYQAAENLYKYAMASATSRVSLEQLGLVESAQTRAAENFKELAAKMERGPEGGGE